MAFRLALKKLARISRQLGVTLTAGITIRRALEIMARKAPGGERRLYHELLNDIDNGATFYEALSRRGRTFPILFQTMIRVGEASGNLDTVLKQLADYYDYVLQARRDLLRSLFIPIFEYCAFIVILAGIQYVMGAFVNHDPAAGEAAALTVLGIGATVGIAPLVMGRIFRFLFGDARVWHEILLRIPVIGGLIRSMALMRFCWCMNLMLDSGVVVFDAITWSLDATANRAFAAKGPKICDDLRQGMPLYQALESSGLFPDDVIEMIHVGEESGSMPDLFARLSKMYQEKMKMVMAALSQVLAWCIYGAVMLAIIYYIFQFVQMYMNALHSVGV